MENLYYLITAVLFIVALKMMTSPRTARAGNLIAAGGMLIAIAGMFLSHTVAGGMWPWIIAGLAVGAVVGTFMAVKVKMTGMPQMVSFFNGMGGLAAGLVAISDFMDSVAKQGQTAGADDWPLEAKAAIAAIVVLAGFISFSGSMVAFLKLQEWIKSRPVVFPAQRIINLLLLAVAVIAIVVLGVSPVAHSWVLYVSIALSLLLGVLLVIAIGGADMPVVISLLNSFTGLSAAATGILLNNYGLIIAGSLVGSSGSILTHLMCKAMNRSLGNVVFGSFGAEVTAGGGGAAHEQRTVKRYTPQDVQMALENASNVVIVPGYGLAVAQAQHITQELAQKLEKRGVSVKFAIHPVAGRMPGHMNVLLAEANVPYSQLMDLEESNSELERADVAIVVGANDVCNPAAHNDPQSPIYGMPILDVEKAKTVVILKRSMAPGFSGIDNDLFYRDSTMMVFGDAKATLTAIAALE
jgi:NAD(P) transhydrogenase subunit beta